MTECDALVWSLFSFCLSKSYWSCFTTPTTNDDHDDIDDIDDIDNGGRGRSLSYHAPHEQVVARHTALSSREYGKGELSGTCHDLISNTTLLLLYTTPSPHSVTTLHHHTPSPHSITTLRCHTTFFPPRPQCHPPTSTSWRKNEVCENNPTPPRATSPLNCWRCARSLARPSPPSTGSIWPSTGKDSTKKSQHASLGGTCTTVCHVPNY